MPRPILLTRVPDHEAELVERLLPDASYAEAALTPALAQKHADTRVLVVTPFDVVPVEVLDALPRLEAVVTRSDGFDHLPLDALRERGLHGYHLGDYATSTVAELTVGLIISLLRRIPEAQDTTRGASPRWLRGHLVGRSLSETTVGVLGTGRIGSRVVERLLALGGRVLGYDLEPDPELDQREEFHYVDTLETLLEQSQVLTVHVPLDESTRGMLDQEALDRLPDRAILVNTARGAVLDQAAVERGLRNGRLGGYAADVLPGEPEPEDLERFQEFDNVLLTPHLGAYDAATIERRYTRTARVAEAVLEGRTVAIEDLRVV